jgi:hypothetical protein
MAFVEGQRSGVPTPGDSTQGMAGWLDLCHMLLAANEFVYVD